MKSSSFSGSANASREESVVFRQNELFDTSFKWFELLYTSFKGLYQSGTAWAELPLILSPAPAHQAYGRLSSPHRHGETRPPPRRKHQMGRAGPPQTPGSPAFDSWHPTSCCGLRPFELWGGSGRWSLEPIAAPPEAAALVLFSSEHGLEVINTEETRLMKCKLCLLLCLVKLTLSDICRHIWQDVRRWMNNHVVAAVYFRCCRPTFLELKYLAKNLCLRNSALACDLMTQSATTALYSD